MPDTVHFGVSIKQNLLDKFHLYRRFKMKRGKLKGSIQYLLVVALLVVILGSKLAIGVEEANEITITDYVGRTVTIPQPVERIVLLQHHLYWVVRLLGAQDKVVGRAKFGGTEYPQIMKKSVAGWWQQPNYEKIAELNPQVVITFWPNPNARGAINEMAEKLESFHIKVVALRTTGMRIKQIETFARILGKEQELAPFLSWRKAKLSQVEKDVSGLGKDKQVRVYNEPDFRGPWTTRLDRVIEFAGGYNIANEIFPSRAQALKESIEREVNPEWVIEKDPEVVILGDWPPRATGYHATDAGDAEKMINQFCQRPGTKFISACINHRVYVIDYKVLAASKSWIGALYLAKILYPNLFEDLDPEEIHRRFYEDWLGINYQGIYVYPSVK